MDEGKRNAEGSVSRDRFRYWRKKQIDDSFYALDIDLMLISKNIYNDQTHPMIVSIIDFKNSKNDGVTFSEALAYNQFKEMGIPVYLICAINDITELKVEKHRFRIVEYEHGEWESNWRADDVPVETDLVADTLSWVGLQEWEEKLREERKQEELEKSERLKEISQVDIGGSTITDYSLLATLREKVKSKPSLVDELVEA